jgi:hypothetical protein
MQMHLKNTSWCHKLKAEKQAAIAAMTIVQSLRKGKEKSGSTKT